MFYPDLCFVLNRPCMAEHEEVTTVFQRNIKHTHILSLLWTFFL